MEIEKLIEELDSCKSINESISTIEDLCWKYGFLPKGKAMFDLHNDNLTKDGNKAYEKLVDFLHDLGNLVEDNISANKLVEEMDKIIGY